MTYLLVIAVLRLVVEHEQIRIPAVGRVEIRGVDHGCYDLGVGQRFQRFVADVHRMLYRSVPVGVFVDNGRQYFGQVISVKRVKSARVNRSGAWISLKTHLPLVEKNRTTNKCSIQQHYTKRQFINRFDHLLTSDFS